MASAADIGLAGNRNKRLGGIALGILTAYLVATALGVAYRESAMLDVLLSLAFPPLALLFVYQGSEKRFVFCVASLFLAGLCFNASPALGVPRAGFSLVFMTIGSMAAPLVVDLLVIDMGRQIHVGPLLARTAQVAFLVTLIPLAGWKLVKAHETILKEDGRLVGELATHLWAEGNTLVVDPVDRKTADRALRRLAIRTKDKTYPLSDADLESVRETHTVRKTTNAHGTEATTQITREQEDRLRLILKLQGTGIPDEVVLFSHRGPLP
ncbi:MAG TPA: hypothetical protein VLF14_12055, partial [Candidatus Binatia bacterium]|nr:hypothetical protein [Candidatus Binatia bacterium]